MTNVQRSADCGNSPKNKIAEDLAVGLETGMLDPSILLDDLVWRDAAGATRVSRDDVLEHLATRLAPVSLTIDNVTSHGKVAAVSGTAKLGDGAERFAHFIRFVSAGAKQVAEIESFRKLER